MRLKKEKNKIRFSFFYVMLLLVFLTIPFLFGTFELINEGNIVFFAFAFALLLEIFIATRYVEFDFDKKTLKLNTLSYNNKTVNLDDISFCILKNGTYHLYNENEQLIAKFSSIYISDSSKVNVFADMNIQDDKQKIQEQRTYDEAKECMIKRRTSISFLRGLTCILTSILATVFFVKTINRYDAIFLYQVDYNTIILFITLTIVFLSLTIGLLLFKKRWFVNCSFAFALSFLVNPLIMIGLLFLNNSTSYTNQFSNYKKFDNCVNNLVDLEFFYDDINDDEVITYHYFVEEDSDRNIEISLEIKVDENKYNEILQYYSEYKKPLINPFEYDNIYVIFEYTIFDFDIEDEDQYVDGFGTFVLFSDETNTIIIEYLHAKDNYSIEDSFIFNRFDIV